MIYTGADRIYCTSLQGFLAVRILCGFTVHT